MGFLYLPGTARNFILGATLTGTNEDSDFPWSELNNKHQYRIGMFSSATLDPTLEADLGSAKSCTFCSVHVHNLDSGTTSVDLESDDNSGFTTPTTRATFTVSSPSFYATFSAGASERYWRLVFNGTNGNPIYLGAWSLGAHSSLTRIQLNDWELRYVMEQIRSEGFVHNRALWRRRAIDLPFRHYTTAQKEEVLAMLDDSKWAEEPLVVVPDDNVADVLWALAPAEWAVRNRAPITVGGSTSQLYSHSLSIEEEIFPVQPAS